MNAFHGLPEGEGTWGGIMESNGYTRSDTLSPEKAWEAWMTSTLAVSAAGAGPVPPLLLLELLPQAVFRIAVVQVDTETEAQPVETRNILLQLTGEDKNGNVGYQIVASNLRFPVKRRQHLVVHVAEDPVA